VCPPFREGDTGNILSGLSSVFYEFASHSSLSCFSSKVGCLLDWSVCPPFHEGDTGHILSGLSSAP
jgi:hypothetical protein